MAFVRLSKEEKRKLFKEGGYREREIMKTANFVTIGKDYKGCIKFHDLRNHRTALYKYGRGWVS